MPVIIDIIGRLSGLLVTTRQHVSVLLYNSNPEINKPLN